ncbi:hypothetical protein FF36_05975 [Frankia torreyi]|uniref:Uncharacterized protein n=1 Tax=Frankia torreyi TaxID=1856 RepID=Q9AF06_9ACTN|nr:hypothetical protein [Frankia torreyi]AAK20148.1 hypothetical protein [Frankia torreyi]KJE19720.1 hypothetical protein FF36_05975 [Frankia torreyi]
MSAGDRRGQVLAALAASPLIDPAASVTQLLRLADELLAAAVPAVEATAMDERLRAEMAASTGTAWTTETTGRRWAA